MQSTEERDLVFILLDESDDDMFKLRLKGLTLKSDMREKLEYALKHAHRSFKDGEIQ
jgi:hypothetical protein